MTSDSSHLSQVDIMESHFLLFLALPPAFALKKSNEISIIQLGCQMSKYNVNPRYYISCKREMFIIDVYFTLSEDTFIQEAELSQKQL